MCVLLSGVEPVSLRRRYRSIINNLLEEQYPDGGVCFYLRCASPLISAIAPNKTAAPITTGTTIGKIVVQYDTNVSVNPLKIVATVLVLIFVSIV